VVLSSLRKTYFFSPQGKRKKKKNSFRTVGLAEGEEVLLSPEEEKKRKAL